MNFKTGYLINLFDIPQTTINEWITRGAIRPIVKGKPGRSHSYQFSFSQSVGIGLASKLRKTMRGCNLPYLTLIVQCFEKLSAQKILEFRERGAIYFIGISSNKRGLKLRPIFYSEPLIFESADLVEICDLLLLSP